MADEALLRYASVDRLGKPSNRHVAVLKEWLDRPEGGDFFLRGREAAMWDKGKDLIAPASREADKDTLTRWISDTLVPWYHCRLGYRFKVFLTIDSAWTVSERERTEQPASIRRRLEWRVAL